MRKIQYPRIRASITISAIMPAPSFCLSDKYIITYTILRKSRTPVKYPAVSSFIKRYFLFRRKYFNSKICNIMRSVQNVWSILSGSYTDQV